MAFYGDAFARSLSGNEFRPRPADSEPHLRPDRSVFCRSQVHNGCERTHGVVEQQSVHYFVERVLIESFGMQGVICFDIRSCRSRSGRDKLYENRPGKQGKKCSERHSPPLFYASKLAAFSILNKKNREKEKCFTTYSGLMRIAPSLPGPDGGIVVLDDSTIYDMAVEILQSQENE